MKLLKQIWNSLSEDKLIIHACEELYKKKDNIIKDALLKHGFISEDLKFLADNFQWQIKENDKFGHLYYHFGQSDEIRIISIERNPETKYSEKEGKYTAETIYKFY